MKSFVILFSIFLVSGCGDGASEKNFFDQDEVNLMLTNESGKNLFNDYSVPVLPLDSIKLYYLDEKGNRILQPYSTNDERNLSVIRGSKNIPAILSLRISMREVIKDRSVTIINFGDKGSLVITAKIHITGLTGPMGGSLYYNNVLFNGRKLQKSARGNYYCVKLV